MYLIHSKRSHSFHRKKWPVHKGREHFQFDGSDRVVQCMTICGRLGMCHRRGGEKLRIFEDFYLQNGEISKSERISEPKLFTFFTLFYSKSEIFRKLMKFRKKIYFDKSISSCSMATWYSILAEKYKNVRKMWKNSNFGWISVKKNFEMKIIHSENDTIDESVAQKSDIFRFFSNFFEISSFYPNFLCKTEKFRKLRSFPPRSYIGTIWRLLISNLKKCRKK